MIPLSVPNLTGNEKKYLDECIDTTFVSSVGQFVTRFEEMTAEISGADYAVATSSGTTALHTALMSVGVEAGDIVLIPSYTFIATANAVAHCGAEPWCLDIEEESWTMSAAVLEDELEKKTETIDGKLYHKLKKRRVAAVMPVFTLGNPADMSGIKRIADRYGLPVIVDAAAAIGTTYGQEAPAEWADAIVYSFNGNKTITCGGGGAVISNNEVVMRRARHLSTTARVGSEYDFDEVGYNYRMTNIQAAVGCAQLERTEEFIARKRYIREYYRQHLCDVEGISFFPESPWGKSTCWFSGIVIGDDMGIGVREICSRLKDEGIESRTFWKPVHLQQPYQSVDCSSMKITDKIWDSIVTLPCSTGITEEELETTVNAVKKVLVRG